MISQVIARPDPGEGGGEDGVLRGKDLPFWGPPNYNYRKEHLF